MWFLNCWRHSPNCGGRLDWISDELPPMVVIMGDHDPAFDPTTNFVGWAAAHHVDVKLVIHTNAVHITYSLSDRKDELFQTMDFFLKHDK